MLGLVNDIDSDIKCTLYVRYYSLYHLRFGGPFLSVCGGHTLGLHVTCIYHFLCLIHCTFTCMHRTICHVCPLSTCLVMSCAGYVIQLYQLMVTVPLSNLTSTISLPLSTSHIPSSTTSFLLLCIWWNHFFTDHIEGKGHLSRVACWAHNTPKQCYTEPRPVDKKHLAVVL